MRIINTFELAVHGLKSKPSRTFLTLLGVAIGVAAVVIIASLGAGTQTLITDEISGLGADLVAVQPGGEPTSMADMANVLYSDSLTQDDIDAILKKKNVPHAVDATPFVLVPGNVTYYNESYVPQIYGTEVEVLSDMFDVYVEEGEFFGEGEIKEKAAVAVIGYKVNQELFGQVSGLGKRISINGKKFRVIGIYPKTGQKMFTDIDTLVIIPYTTAQTYLTGEDHFNEIWVRIDDSANARRTEQDIELTLRELHNLEENEDNDFVIRTPESIMEQVNTILLSLTIFLTAVVAVALVVGGIGIMNMMLVSVTERTREIGLRKAIGATDTDVLSQFLIEAMLLTFMGGAFGIVSGALISYGAGLLVLHFSSLNWTFQLPVAVSVGALVFSVVIGLVFGLYPARKASKKSPMEALRYE